MNGVTVISRTQRIIVNPAFSSFTVVSKTNHIVVTQAVSSVSVINAGPPGPPGAVSTVPGPEGPEGPIGETGPQGPVGPSEAASVLTVDGQILTRAAGVLAPITRANLAADTAFTSRYTTVVNHGAVAGTARTGTAAILWIGSVDPTNAQNDDELFRTDTVVLSKRVAGAWVVVSGSIFVGNSPPPAPTEGKLWWDTDDVAVVPPLSAADMANDSAFTSKYPRVLNHGATAGTARNGTAPIFWIGSVNPTNTTDNDELYRTDLVAKFVRVGGAWIEVGSTRYAAIAQGRLYVGGAWDAVTSGTTQLIVGTSSAIPVVNTRKYGVYVYLEGDFGSVTGDSFTIGIQQDGVQIYSCPIATLLGGAYIPPSVIYAPITPTTGSKVFRATATRAGGTGTLQFRGKLVVMDEGLI